MSDAVKSCVVCGGSRTFTKSTGYPGYVEATNFVIHGCSECGAHFISPENLEPALYDMIYAGRNTAGYDRYLRYAQEIGSVAQPLKFLADSEVTYFPVYNFLKGSRPLRILDVGCGYGYLTFALRALGHDASGIDLSHEAISFAKKQFGDFFRRVDLDEMIPLARESFDLIVVVEVIEHVRNPREFLGLCRELLRPGGGVILTTPNKDYYPDNSIWQTDLPPVHVSWLGRGSLEVLANKLDFRSSFFDMENCVHDRDNNLRWFWVSRRERRPDPVLTVDGKLAGIDNPQRSRIRNLARWAFISNPWVKLMSNALHALLVRKSHTLGVLLRKS